MFFDYKTILSADIKSPLYSTFFQNFDRFLDGKRPLTNKEKSINK